MHCKDLIHVWETSSSKSPQWKTFLFISSRWIKHLQIYNDLIPWAHTMHLCHSHRWCEPQLTETKRLGTEQTGGLKTEHRSLVSTKQYRDLVSHRQKRWRRLRLSSTHMLWRVHVGTETPAHTHRTYTQQSCSIWLYMIMSVCALARLSSPGLHSSVVHVQSQPTGSVRCWGAMRNTFN